jgi:hypothetical protein
MAAGYGPNPIRLAAWALAVRCQLDQVEHAIILPIGVAQRSLIGERPAKYGYLSASVFVFFFHAPIVRMQPVAKHLGAE